MSIGLARNYMLGRSTLVRSGQIDFATAFREENSGRATPPRSDDVPNDRAAADQLAAYTAIENGQARDARKIAEALFQPKPTTKTDDLAQPAATTQQEVARVPRILTVTEPRHDSIPSLEQASEPALGTSKPVEAAPESEHSRIRTLLAYGMTVGEVPELYDVAKDEIEHIANGQP